MDGRSGSPAGFNVRANDRAEMGREVEGSRKRGSKKKKCNLFYTWSIIICGLCGRTEDEMGFDGAAFNGQCPDPTACSLTLTHMLTSTLPRAQFKKLINMPPPLIIRKLGEWPAFTYLRTCTEQKVGIVEAQSWFQISRKRDQDFE